MILVLNVIEKNFNRQLTSKSTKSKKSSKSGKSSKKAAAQDEDAKSHKSGKSGKSEKSGKSKAEEGADKPFDPLKEPVLKEKGWFTKQNVQNFIHHFI